MNYKKVVALALSVSMVIGGSVSPVFAQTSNDKYANIDEANTEDQKWVLNAWSNEQDDYVLTDAEELQAKDIFKNEEKSTDEDDLGIIELPVNPVYNPNEEELTTGGLFGEDLGIIELPENPLYNPNNKELNSEDLFGQENQEEFEAWTSDLAPANPKELTSDDLFETGEFTEAEDDSKTEEIAERVEELYPEDKDLLAIEDLSLLTDEQLEYLDKNEYPENKKDATAKDIEWLKDNEGSDYVKDGEDLDPTDLFGNESAEWAEDIAPELPEEATVDDFTWREDHKRAEDSEDDLKPEVLWSFEEFENEEWSDDQGEFNPFEDKKEYTEFENEEWVEDVEDNELTFYSEFENEEWSDDQGEFNPFEDEKEYIDFENEEWVEDVEDNELTFYSEFENAEWTNTDKELEEVEWLEVEEEREIDPNDPTTFPIFTDHEYKEKEIDPNDPTTFPLFEDHELAEEEEEKSTTIENARWTNTDNEVITIAEILGGN